MKIITLVLALVVVATSCEKELVELKTVEEIQAGTQELSCTCIGPNAWQESGEQPLNWIASIALQGNSISDTSYVTIEWDVARQVTIPGIGTLRDTITLSHTFEVMPGATYDQEETEHETYREFESYVPNSARFIEGETPGNPYQEFYPIGYYKCPGGGYEYRRGPL